MGTRTCVFDFRTFKTEKEISDYEPKCETQKLFLLCYRYSLEAPQIEKMVFVVKR